MPRNCHGLSIKGSGYVKPDGASGDKMAEEMKKMMDARANQDSKYFPQALTAISAQTPDPKKK